MECGLAASAAGPNTVDTASPWSVPSEVLEILAPHIATTYDDDNHRDNHHPANSNSGEGYHNSYGGGGYHHNSQNNYIKDRRSVGSGSDWETNTLGWQHSSSGRASKQSTTMYHNDGTGRKVRFTGAPGDHQSYKPAHYHYSYGDLYPFESTPAFAADWDRYLEGKEQYDEWSPGAAPEEYFRQKAPYTHYSMQKHVTSPRLAGISDTAAGGSSGRAQRDTIDMQNIRSPIMRAYNTADSYYADPHYADHHIPPSHYMQRTTSNNKQHSNNISGSMRTLSTSKENISSSNNNNGSLKRKKSVNFRVNTEEGTRQSSFAGRESAAEKARDTQQLGSSSPNRRKPTNTISSTGSSITGRTGSSSSSSNPSSSIGIRDQRAAKSLFLVDHIPPPPGLERAAKSVQEEPRKKSVKNSSPNRKTNRNNRSPSPRK